VLKPVFVDTGFVIALINQDDDHHAEAQLLSERYENSPFITTDAVLLEVVNALAKNFRVESAHIIHYFQDSSDVTVVRLNPVLFNRGLALYESYGDKTWGLVDCVSFVVMREMDVMEATMNTLHEQLITEIQHIPDKHLQALFNLIHAFRTDLNNEQVDKPVNIRQFAGVWADMDEAVTGIRSGKNATVRLLATDSG